MTDRLVRPADSYQGSSLNSEGHRAFSLAKACYESAGLKGSDVIDVPLGAAVGAEIDCRSFMAKKGVIPVSAPAEKRLALSWIALHAASFAFTTDALDSSLLGGLVSALCFRRCTMAMIDELFRVIPPAELCTGKPVLRPLNRKAAEELVIAAVLRIIKHLCSFS